ncbi:hypothetical protein CPB83DRAFT_893366 [Crepidotus variabilis]|uniref:Uncharacterized protein n=1 Tax=Crepidotus variabilis TaxID=179855 RepID=A0A9P6EJ04_9AGAR|nr:hypothetical protein CPB83DRAFT_893366 [Crepidotus variabilis]
MPVHCTCRLPKPLIAPLPLNAASYVTSPTSPPRAYAEVDTQHVQQARNLRALNTSATMPSSEAPHTSRHSSLPTPHRCLLILSSTCVFVATTRFYDAPCPNYVGNMALRTTRSLLAQACASILPSSIFRTSAYNRKSVMRFRTQLSQSVGGTVLGASGVSISSAPQRHAWRSRYLKFQNYPNIPIHCVPCHGLILDITSSSRNTEADTLDTLFRVTPYSRSLKASIQQSGARTLSKANSNAGEIGSLKVRWCSILET